MLGNLMPGGPAALASSMFINGVYGANNHLPRRVIVGNLNKASVFDANNCGDLIFIATKNSRHRPSADRHRILHGVATLAQPCRVTNLQAASRQSRILAKGMSGANRIFLTTACQVLTRVPQLMPLMSQTTLVARFASFDEFIRPLVIISNKFSSNASFTSSKHAWLVGAMPLTQPPCRLTVTLPRKYKSYSKGVMCLNPCNGTNVVLAKLLIFDAT